MSGRIRVRGKVSPEIVAAIAAAVRSRTGVTERPVVVSGWARKGRVSRGWHQNGGSRWRDGLRR